MELSDWTITVVTPGKIYKGKVCISGPLDRRTLSLLNTPVRTTRYDEMPSLEGYLQLDDVTLTLGKIKKSYQTLSVQKSDIIFVYDEFKSMGSDLARKRFQTMKTPVNTVTLEIISKNLANTSYQFTGLVYSPRNRLTGNESFLPVTEVLIEKLVPNEAEPSILAKRVPFVAINKNYIESVYFHPKIK